MAKGEDAWRGEKWDKGDSNHKRTDRLTGK
jgi:hypothetical protein